MLSAAERQVLEHLWEFLSRRRRARFEEILSRRTRCLTLVLEDVYQPHNQSAVLRTAEAVGLQDVHLIESANRMRIDREISMSSDRWLTIHRHRQDDAERNTADCLGQLKDNGFRILVSTPRPPATPLQDVTFRQKTALVIGHETDGVSETALELADERVAIPMWGFVESLNLSVAAALCLYELRRALDVSGLDRSLSQEDMQALKLCWARRSIPNVAAIEGQFRAEKSASLTR